VYGRNDIGAQVRLYEVLREGATAPSAAESEADEDNDELRLIQRRRISARRPGWEVFKLRNVIQRWLDDPSTNRGDFIIIVIIRVLVVRLLHYERTCIP